MKRLIIVSLVVILAALAVTAVVYAVNNQVKVDGNTVSWTVDGNEMQTGEKIVSDVGCIEGGPCVSFEVEKVYEETTSENGWVVVCYNNEVCVTGIPDENGLVCEGEICLELTDRDYCETADPDELEPGECVPVLITPVATAEVEDGDS